MTHGVRSVFVRVFTCIQREYLLCGINGVYRDNVEKMLLLNSNCTFVIIKWMCYNDHLSSVKGYGKAMRFSYFILLYNIPEKLFF